MNEIRTGENEWRVRQSGDPVAANELARNLGVPVIIASLLIDRGINTFEDARLFFRPEFNLLHDPFLMKDMAEAVERLSSAVHHKEKIMIYGDYDVDGTTAVTMVYDFLQNLGMSCIFYIPDRYEEGYGFSNRGVEEARIQGCSLIITLDCGIKDGDKVELAKGYGIDVIICDHHRPEQLPGALAVLDPMRNDCPYPFKGLSGCGVGFKLLQAFCLQQGLPVNTLEEYLDLVAISIAADIVPLTGENRILAFYGLQRLCSAPRSGVQALLRQSSFKKRNLCLSDIVFILAPRINAAGRIVSGKKAVELLASKTAEEAWTHSTEIENNNTYRKTLDKQATIEAKEMVAADENFEGKYSVIVRKDDWSKGVIGIVASRLVEEFHRPAIVCCHSNGKLTASGRSIDGFDLFNALEKCSELLVQFGGHAMAAGLTMLPENLELFREKFELVAGEMLNYSLPVPSLEADIEIDFEMIDGKLFRILQMFEPFGPGNMKPLLLTRNVCNAGHTKLVGSSFDHLKLHICQKKCSSISFNGIGFGMKDFYDGLRKGQEVDILYTLETNEWNGQTSVQLNIKEIRWSLSP